jgi:hypothetical protein
MLRPHFSDNCITGKTLADQIGACREESKASRLRLLAFGVVCIIYSFA